MFVNDLESAQYYDTLPRFSKNIYNYLASIGLKNKTIADVGVGTGRIAIDLLEEGNTVYGIDPDINMRSICENKLKGYKNFKLIVGTDSEMNIPDKSVDYVIVSQSYHRFDPELFKKECNRVLKDKDNVIIMWYRVDFKNPIFSDMLESVKKNYKDYETRYTCDEITGAKQEEEANNIDANNFFNGNSHMENIISNSYLDLDEFLTLGLSLALFPITHKMNSVSEVLRQESFHKKQYVKDLKDISLYDLMKIKGIDNI